MTKEELKKEAEEYLKRKLEERKNKLVIELPEVYITDLQQAYLASAEPREKRIAELEAQIEKMKCWCNCKNYISCLEECCRKNISFEKVICYNCKKWELRGIKEK